MPRADIFLRLLERLEIGSDDFSLKEYFPMSREKDFNQRCENLCRLHQYEDLQTFLLKNEVIESVSEGELQAYYYYLAVAQYQAGKLMEAEQNFQLALVEGKKLDLISRLSLASLGILNANRGQRKDTKAYFEQAFNDLSKVNYEENLNVLFYLQAYAQRTLGDISASLTSLEAGIRFISLHNSHYMLANFYYLAAELAVTKKADLIHNSRLFSDLYQEKIYKI